MTLIEKIRQRGASRFGEEEDYTKFMEVAEKYIDHWFPDQKQDIIFYPWNYCGSDVILLNSMGEELPIDFICGQTVKKLLNGANPKNIQDKNRPIYSL